MKWINAEQQVTVTIYDEEHEEHLDKTMTVEEMLDTYTNEGCPTMYINPERKIGEWIDCTEDGYVECPFCHSATNCDGNKEELHFCFSCGADMRGEGSDNQ